MEKRPETLVDYLNEYQQEITARVHAQAPPRWKPGQPTDPLLDTALRPPYPAQADVIMSAARTLDHEPGVYICGEMGTGKTLIGSLIPWIHHKKHSPRVLVMCPGHLTKKWKRELEQTIPDANAEIINNTSDAVRLAARPRQDRPEFWVISKETAKLGYFSHAAARTVTGMTNSGNAVIQQRKIDTREGITRTAIDSRGKALQVNITNAYCPDCGKPIEKPPKTKNGLPIPVELKDLEKKRHVCPHCANRPNWKDSSDHDRRDLHAHLRELGKSRRGERHTALWEADRTRQRKIAIADYFKRRRVSFDFLIADEVHELKGSDTAQGNALGKLGSCSDKIISLTGTLIGGYSTHLFYLNYRMNAAAMKRAGYKYGRTAAWVDEYGIREIVIRETKSADGTRNTRSHGAKNGTNTGQAERPGISPALFGEQLLNSAIFVHLEDVTQHLPSYTEMPVPVQMSDEQSRAYKALELRIKNVMDKQLAMGNRRLLSVYLQTLLSYPDKPFENDPIELDAESVIVPEDLPQDIEYPKEEELIRIAHEAKTAGRKTLVYVQNTGKKDLLPRIKEILTRYGIVAEYMRATLKPKKREAWIKKTAPNIDALIVNPECVKTGLDLIEFPTVVFLQTGYNVFTVRQAARRSWRIGQTQPVEIYFLYYEQTMQSRAVHLVGKKISASAALDGKLTAEGLIALAGEDEDAAMQLARALCEGGLEDENSIESFWRKPTDNDRPFTPPPQPTAGQVIPFPERVAEQPALIDPEELPAMRKKDSLLPRGMVAATRYTPPRDAEEIEREAGRAEARAAYNYIPKSANVPKLYSTEHDKDPLVRVKLFCPWSSWTWYIIEYSETAPDGTKDLAFGLVDGFEKELGYIDMTELRELRGGPGGALRIERDIHWTPTPLSAVRGDKPKEEEPDPEPAQPTDEPQALAPAACTIDNAIKIIANAMPNATITRNPTLPEPSATHKTAALIPTRSGILTQELDENGDIITSKLIPHGAPLPDNAIHPPKTNGETTSLSAAPQPLAYSERPTTTTRHNEKRPSVIDLLSKKKALTARKKRRRTSTPNNTDQMSLFG